MDKTSLKMMKAEVANEYVEKNKLNIVITGGNNGIGYETAKALYEGGHSIVFGSRNVEKN